MMNISKKAYLIGFIVLFLSCKNDDDNNIVNNTGTFEGVIDWTKSFGGSSDDVINDVISTSDGGFAYFGTSKSIDGDISDKIQEENDFWLFKTDAEGNLLWSKTFGGSNDDQGQKIAQTVDGGFIITGFSMSNDGDASVNAGIQDKWILRLDATGNILWEKSFGFSGSDQAYSVIPTSDNGFMMVGFLDITASGGAGNDFSNATQHGVGEFWAHKLDANGNLEWRRYFGGTNNDRAYDVLETSDGGYIIAGAAESNDFDISDPKGSYDYWVIKINSSGTLIWEKSFGGSEIDICYAIAQTSDGNFVLAGDSRSADGDITGARGNADFWILKIDPNGNTIWQKSFGGSAFDSARGAAPTSDGGVLISGASRSSDVDLSQNLGQNDFWIMKLSSSGTIEWQNSYGGTGLDFSYDILQTSDNKILAVGSSDSTDNQVSGNHGGQDAWVLKIK